MVADTEVILQQLRAQSVELRRGRFSRLKRHPDVGGGNVVIRNTGIIATHIAERFAAGDTIDGLAFDFRVERHDIEQCLRVVIAGACGSRGIGVAIERRMEVLVPVEPPPAAGAVDPVAAK